MRWAQATGVTIGARCNALRLLERFLKFGAVRVAEYGADISDTQRCGGQKVGAVCEFRLQPCGPEAHGRISPEIVPEPAKTDTHQLCGFGFCQLSSLLLESPQDQIESSCALLCHEMPPANLDLKYVLLKEDVKMSLEHAKIFENKCAMLRQNRGSRRAYQEFNGNHSYINWRGSFGEGLIALLGQN